MKMKIKQGWNVATAKLPAGPGGPGMPSRLSRPKKEKNKTKQNYMSVKLIY